MVPTTTIRDVVVSRLAIGGNPFSGISHHTRQRDLEMADYFSAGRTKETLHECEENGITVFCGRIDNHIIRLLREYWNEGGQIKWFAQTAPEHRSHLENIRAAAGNGASAIYIQGHTARQFREAGGWKGFGEAIDLVRSLGLLAGSATHQPDFHAARRAAGIELDFCLQSLYDIEGRKGNIFRHDQGEQFDDADRLRALEAIAANPEPTFAYKVLAAGRKHPRESLPEVARYLKPTDGVLMGMWPRDNPHMVRENAELVAELLGPETAPAENRSQNAR